MYPSLRHVILDRDGVLNVERSDGGYIENWTQWQWIAGALEALAMLGGAGVHVSVATNQAGVGRGLITRDALDAIHARMIAEAARSGGVITDVFVCPHLPGDHCACRKPAPGLLQRAIEAARIPACSTIAVGDDLRDLEAARAADIAPMLVRTGKGRATEATCGHEGVPVFDDLLAFASAVTANAPFATEGTP